jgi:7-cyano-7-deazaguanine reductase
MNLKALQESADKNKYIYDEVDNELLERFPKPVTACPSDLQLKIEVPEFTSLCPLTGQPDFAKIVIRYEPDQWCVESKSLKLYMMSYRNHGAFHESCVSQMLDDLVALLEPEWMTIEGRFTPRGGIPFWPVVSYHR